MNIDESLDTPGTMLSGPRRICSAKARFSLGQSYWGIRVLKWAAIDAPEHVPVRAEMAAGLAAVSAACDLRFEESDPRSANLVLSSGRGPRADFDGPGGTLAWFQLPKANQKSGTLLGRLDLDDFSRANAHAPRPRPVIWHELGHGLGLPHLPKGNLLQEFYDEAIDRYLVGDVLALQKLYGPPRGEPRIDPINPDQWQLRELHSKMLEWQEAQINALRQSLAIPADLLKEEMRRNA